MARHAARGAEGGGMCSAGVQRGARATVAVVSTAMEAARRCLEERSLRPESVTDAMATLEAVSERDCATPATYASRLAALNSVSVMASVAVKVTTDVQSEHALQGPPSALVKPAEQ